jgi:hypothetical protein
MRYILCFTLFIQSFVSFSATDFYQLSPTASVSLLSCDPGDDLYSIFGHSALRVADPEGDFDVVYNYGTFSFNDDFYFHFVMGKLNYKLAREHFENFLGSYHYENRSVREQILNLTQAEKQLIFEFLENNHLPENRYYLYDFFYDNCSSRIRDVIEKCLGDKLQFSDPENKSEQETFRNMIDRYLIPMPWADFGIDIGLGLPTDKKVTVRERMFLPDELFDAFENASINEKKLVANTRILYQAVPQNTDNTFFTPIIFGWILLLISILISLLHPLQKLIKIWTFLLYFSVSLCGLLVAFLWFITDHTATDYNFNLMWANPLFFISAIGVFFTKRDNAFFDKILSLNAIIIVLMLVGWLIIPQQLHVAVVPIALSLLCLIGQHKLSVGLKNNEVANGG